MTEGVKYIGSKNKLIPSIIEVVRTLPAVRTIFDGFAGTTRVGQAFRANGYTVYSNDISDYSYVFGKCYIETNDIEIIDAAYSIIEDLNIISGKVGFLTEYYSGGSESKKNDTNIINDIMFWQRKNTLKADAIREVIEDYRDSPVYYILLTSLIFALDKVDNTVGVQQAFLKKSWAKRSFNDVKLLLPSIFVDSPKGKVFKGDTNNIIKDVVVDVAYYDPPYTTHNYSSYYHIWDTIVRNDYPEVTGIINRRKNVAKSAYNSKVRATETFNELIQNTVSRFILISYNNEGIIPFKDLMSMAEDKGAVDVTEIDYKRNVMSRIGIYNSEGEVVGTPGKSNNIEYIIKITCS